MLSCVRLRIHGYVQGVNFRYLARRRAQGLGLTGWVRNREDGTVEALACGEPEAVAAFGEWCRQGPPSARVDRVEVHPEDASEPTGGFAIR